MKKLILIGFIVFVALGAFAQTSIGLGWAQNSVNSPVFRKNSVASFGGVQYTAYYDSLGNVILAKRNLGTELWDTTKTQYKGNINDAHCSISIGVDGNGFLHMAWDHHNNALRYCMAMDSGSMELGDNVTMIGNNENDVTYPEFFRMPNGDLLFMYRYGVSGQGNMVINKYVVNEKKWIRLHDILIDGEGQRNAYWQSCVSSDGVIHVSWVWRETWEVQTNHDMCYAKSLDGGLTWVKSTGEQYTIPITASTAEYALQINQNSELINQTSIYATSDGTPYIASYWDDAVTKTPQYQLIYLDSVNIWKRKTISDRLTTFSLSGGGTKKIPISRPQVMVDESGANPIVYVLYRDSERDSKVSMNVCKNMDADTLQWFIYDLTDFSVHSWEPSYDMDLWKDSAILNIFVQKMGQGDGETLENLPAQPVYVWNYNKSLLPQDTITTPTIIAEKASLPVPEINSKDIEFDTVLSWTPGKNAASHLVYMGTSLASLTFYQETSDTFLMVNSLENGKMYYWRVDEKAGDHVTKGNNWYFKTKTIVAIHDIGNDYEMKAYPQPAAEMLFIENTNFDSIVSIYTMLGNKIQTSKYENGIYIHKLKDGIYMLSVNNDAMLKFIKRSN